MECWNDENTDTRNTDNPFLTMHNGQLTKDNGPL